MVLSCFRYEDGAVGEGEIDEQDEGGKVDAEDGPVDLVLLDMEEIIGEDDANDWINGPDEDIGLEKTGISCEP